MAKNTFLQMKKIREVDKKLLELAKEQAQIKKKILDVFKDGPRTVPEIAELSGLKPAEAMQWVMALRKYGFLEETNEVTEDGYYKYKLVRGGQK